MKVFEYVNANIDRVRSEVKGGVNSWTLIWHWEIYARYDTYRKQGETTMIAVIRICDEFKIKTRMVFHIIRKMEAEFESTDNKLQPAIDAEKNG